MRKKKLLFIINPISGIGKKSGIPHMVNSYIDEDRYDPEIYFTNYKGDAVNEAARARGRGTDIVVAVGGDGTINEIASQLTGSDTALGIIPLGSGNGLARHLGIPMKSEDAMKRINHHKGSIIDTAYLNGVPFFNVAGIGFDAFVVYLFSKLSGRGFLNYARATWTAFQSFKSFNVKIFSAGIKLYEGEAFILSFANSCQFGNNCYINPNGIIHDGRIEIVLLKPFPKILAPMLVWRLFTKKIFDSQYVLRWSLSEATLETSSPINVQIDGDLASKMTKIELKVEHAALRVVV